MCDVSIKWGSENFVCEICLLMVWPSYNRSWVLCWHCNQQLLWPLSDHQRMLRRLQCSAALPYIPLVSHDRWGQHYKQVVHLMNWMTNDSEKMHNELNIHIYLISVELVVEFLKIKGWANNCMPYCNLLHTIFVCSM